MLTTLSKKNKNQLSDKTKTNQLFQWEYKNNLIMLL